MKTTILSQHDTYKDAAAKRESETKKRYYLKNRENILKKNQDYINKRKALQNEQKINELKNNLELENIYFETKYVKIFDIICVLQKDRKNYLWRKHVSLWNNLDWAEFNLLKES
jgi:hypothetical protein